MGLSADVPGGHVILKANGNFLQSMNARLGEDPLELDEVAPPYFVDTGGLPEPVRRVKAKTPPVKLGKQATVFFPRVHLRYYHHRIGRWHRQQIFHRVHLRYCHQRVGSVGQEHPSDAHTDLVLLRAKSHQ